MKLHFDSKQEFQLEAIKAITDIFEGQPLSSSDFEFSISQPGALLTENGFGNKLAFPQLDQLAENIQLVQKIPVTSNVYDSRKVSGLRSFASANSIQILVINIDSFAKDENIINNPNVFQICTLNETKPVIKKRQEIGRGLRLSVNQDGERIFDRNINRLTVIANERYDDFAKAL